VNLPVEVFTQTGTKRGFASTDVACDCNVSKRGAVFRMRHRKQISFQEMILTSTGTFSALQPHLVQP